MAWEGWRADYGAWKDAVLTQGIPAFVVGVKFLPPWQGDRLLALVLEIEEMNLPRSHEDRGFKLHVTLAFESELTEELAAAALRAHRRWAGRNVVLNIGWVGRGGAAFLDDADPIAADADIHRLHDAGYYATRGLHVSL